MRRSENPGRPRRLGAPRSDRCTGSARRVERQNEVNEQLRRRHEPGGPIRGEYLVVDPDELADLKPRSTRPIYFDHTYWVAPDGETAERPYRLLLAVMQDRQRVGIGTVVMRNKQYLGAVRPLDGARALSTKRFADEVVPKADVSGLPEQDHDTATDELEDLIARKAKGEDLVIEESDDGADAEIIDLMAARSTRKSA